MNLSFVAGQKDGGRNNDKLTVCGRQKEDGTKTRTCEEEEGANHAVRFTCIGSLQEKVTRDAQGLAY